jgi:hypothetical protein
MAWNLSIISPMRKTILAALGAVLFPALSWAQGGAFSHLQGIRLAQEEIPSSANRGWAGKVNSAFNETHVQALGPARVSGEPDAQVDLQGIKDRYLKAADSFFSGSNKTFVSIHFDGFGGNYLSLWPEDRDGPMFFKLARGMAGAWNDGGNSYEMGLDVFIFRARSANHIQVRERESRTLVYDKPISELQDAVFRVGEPVTVGGREYRLFYSYSVDAKQDPACFDRKRFGIVLVERRPDLALRYRAYIVPSWLVAKGSVKAFLFENMQVVGFELSPDGNALSLYSLPGR